MLGIFPRRFSQIGKAFYSTGNTSALGKLRKVTGYSVSNCKKALEMFPNDLPKAEEWLHSEAKKMGWSKWNKIQSRSAAQGLVGVYCQDNLGIMVEVNCETDFVAKNTEFQKLVGNVLMSCLENEKQFTGKQQTAIEKHLLDERDLMSLKCQTSTIEELVNFSMSKFSEKTVVKRALLMKTMGNPAHYLCGLSHPTISCPTIHQRITMGKFGALLALEKINIPDEEIAEFSSNMCQHVIGMMPASTGVQDFIDLYEAGKIVVGDTPTKETVVEPKSEKPPEDAEQENREEAEETAETVSKDSDETRLLFQPYLLDTTMHVYDYMWKKANVLGFERFECGGETRKEEEVQKVANVGM